MNLPYRLGEPLDGEVWQQVRLRTIFECCKWDMQSEDRAVLAPFPLLLEASEWQQLCATAEALAAEAAAAEDELRRRPRLRGRLGLPGALLKALDSDDDPAPGVARVMRFDFHFTREGWKISEVNADVPGGFIEASGFTRLVATCCPGAAPPPDPAVAYARALARRFGPQAMIALVHATAYSDDHQVMQYLGAKMAAEGLRVILAAPTHLRWERGRAAVSSSFASTPVDSVVRFFPAEWLPNLPNPAGWTPYFTSSRTPVSNPASAVLVQSKRFPLVWDDLDCKLPTWRRTMPESRSPAGMPSRQWQDWVLKPALGRVGEDVGIAGVTPEAELQRIRRAAWWRPSAWVAQRRFEAVPVASAAGQYYPCIGVFTLDGRAVGAYGRVASKPLIDQDAQDIAVLIPSAGDDL